jgi:hypothetical protein
VNGNQLKKIMETVLPDAALQRVVGAAGFEQRERKRDALEFLRAMLVSAASPAGGRQADIMRTYFENGTPRVARGSFYDWFGPPLEDAMSKLSKITQSYAASQPKELPGVLGCVDDWLIIDSTTARRMLATCAFRIADALQLHGSEVNAEWEHLAAVIVHTGKDPNWRRKPSILDQFRGWKILPSSRIHRAT